MVRDAGPRDRGSYSTGLAGSCIATVAARPAVAALAPIIHHSARVFIAPVVAADTCEGSCATDLDEARELGLRLGAEIKAEAGDRLLE